MSLRDTVHAGLKARLCLLPLREDGSKAPDVPTWKQYQMVRPTLAELKGPLFSAVTPSKGTTQPPGCPYGRVMGAVSTIAIYPTDERKRFSRPGLLTIGGVRRTPGCRCLVRDLVARQHDSRARERTRGHDPKHRSSFGGHLHVCSILLAKKTQPVLGGHSQGPAEFLRTAERLQTPFWRGSA